MTARKISRNKSAVHDINYHLVFVTKYRKRVLDGDTVSVLKRLLRDIAARRGLEIISLSIQPDHVQLFISSDPFQTPRAIVKSFKGETALKLFRKFPSLRLHLWKGAVWSPSYPVSTAGSISSETVKKYIEQQGTGCTGIGRGKTGGKWLTPDRLREVSAIHPPVTDQGFSGRLV